MREISADQVKRERTNGVLSPLELEVETAERVAQHVEVLSQSGREVG